MNAPARIPFRGDVEGLRALAILLVVAFHVEVPGWAGGFLGVDVFFVISGYLITALLTSELERSGRIDLRGFYARRARRLLPASALMVVVTLVAAHFLLAPLELERLANTAKATAAYVANFYFIGQSANYFAPDIKANALLHTWSLAVEEQFYLIWPAAFALAFRLARTRRSLAVAGSLITLGSLAAWATVSGPWAFFGSPARAWEFGLGALASLVPAALLRRRGGGALCVAMSAVGLVAILASAHWFAGRTAVPRLLTLAPTLGTAALLLAGASAPRNAVTRLLGSQPLLAIGRLSYGCYLWHWPILVIAKLTQPAMTLNGRLLCALAAFGICALSYWLVERPIRTQRYLARRPVVSLVSAAALTVATFATAVAWKHAAAAAIREPKYRPIIDAVNEQSILNPGGCLYPKGDVVECEFGDRASPTTVVLFGDSLVAEWATIVDAIARERGWRLVTVLKAACSPADVLMPDGPDECSAWRERAIRRITELRPAAVLVSCSRLYPRYYGYERWRDGFRRTMEAFAAAKIATVLMATTPMTGLDVPACTLRALRRGSDTSRCDGERGVALDARFVQMQSEAITGLENVKVADFSDVFCDGAVCPAMKNGTLVYLDGTHASAAFLRTLAPALSKLLAESVDAD